MGRYVNPGNEGFASIVADEYVDKTGLITLFDSTLNTQRKLVMVSRPRRFGKSFAAQSLVAFYSREADSRALFEERKVARTDGWDVNLNKYKYRPVLITQSVEELITKTMDSNFVPITDDRGMFIGIVTRRSIIKHYYEKNILPQE
jgi:hypothetical protein